MGAPAVYGVARRRGEIFVPAQSEFLSPSPAGPIVDPSHLFFGHRVQPRTRFEVKSPGPNGSSIACEVAPVRDIELAKLRTAEPLAEQGEEVLAINVERAPGGDFVPLLLTFGGLENIHISQPSKLLPALRFVGPGDVNPVAIGGLWDRVVLTPEESKVVDVLRTIEPEIERVASVSHLNRRGPAGMIVKTRSTDRPVPLASLGNGVSRLMALALNLAASSGGVLLVDELEVGLHHSIMERVWRLLIEGAKRLDVQIFATTHSQDCLRGLARAVEEHSELAPDVSVHRVEMGHERDVLFASSELEIAARNQIELR